jgi:hypothetical protein
MATQKETLERLLNKEEIVYWSEKNGIQIQEIPAGFLVDEWKVNLDENNYIVSVERALDEPREL